jgi:hypothetical protein
MPRFRSLYPIILLLFALLPAGHGIMAQRIDGEEFLSPRDLDVEWQRITRSSDGKQLLAEAKRHGRQARPPRSAGWGWKAQVLSEGAGREPVVFCIYELHDKEKRPAGILLRLQRGGRGHLSLILPGSNGSLEHADEFQVDNSGRVVRSEGWSRRIMPSIIEWCGTACTQSITPCGQPGEKVNIRKFFSCVTSICGSCVLVSMLVSGRL